MNTRQKILIFTDFTELGQKNIEWGVFFAKKFDKDLLIIHVIDDNTRNYFKNDNLTEQTKELLSEICTEINAKEAINAEYYAEEGCTCTIINSIAEKIDAFLVVLGTHGQNDIQFLSGVDTGKIIRKARIPYFVLQKSSPAPDAQKNIFFPVDFRKENKEKTGWTSYLAKYIKTEIKIILSNNNENTIKNNVIFCSKFFKELDLNYEKIILPNSVFSNIENLTLKYAKNNDALCVVILTTKAPDLLTKLFGFREDKIIANKQGIPILCINPKKDLYIPCI